MKDPVRPGAMAREENIFNAAVQIIDATERGACLDESCSGDPALRARIEKLLAVAHDPFFNTPVTPDRLGASQISTADFSFEAPSGRIGRYKLLEKIGEGGCGVVYMAEQEEPVRRRVALKVIKLGMDTRSVISRFEAERQALAMMDHPNIAKVLDAGATEAGRPFFVMELVRGTRITHYCDQNNLSTRARLALFMEVCHAIQHAHQKGIIHRDIKPSNILVTLHDGVPVPKVIDFGIAKATTDQRLTDKTLFTALEQFIGTPAYMSPEQAEMSGLDIDTRSDIYSLGVLLYELLTGRTPFDGKELIASGVDEMRRTIREKEPVRPSTRLSTMLEGELTTSAKHRQSDAPRLITLLLGDLDWIVMKCLEKDRIRRYETANGLASDLQRHLSNEAVLARPASTVYRFQKMVRRNKVAFAAAASITAVLVTGVIVSAWQAVRATRAEREQSRQRAASVEQRKLADMQLALQAWEEGDLRRANDLIDASRPAAGDAPPFEWRYLRKLCQDESSETFGGTNDQYKSAQFSGRDSLLLSDGKVLTLKNLFGRRDQWLIEDRDGIWTHALCSANTNLLATMTRNGRIKLWDFSSGRVRIEFEGHPRTAPGSSHYNLSFSPDGRWLASAISDDSLKLWDIQGGNLTPVRTVHRYAQWNSGGEFSSDGDRLFSGGSESIIRTWDVAAGGEAEVPLEGHTSWVYSLAIAPDGLRLASGGEDSRVIIWDVLARKIESKFLGHTAQILTLAYSPDGHILASGGSDHTIRLWDTKTGQQLSLLRGHGAAVRSLSFSSSGERLVSRSADGLVKLWVINTGQEHSVLTRGSSSLQEVASSADGKHLAAVGGSDFTVDLWDLSTRSATVLSGHSSSVRCAVFSPDGTTLATGSHDRTVRLWNVSDQKSVGTLTNGFPVGSLAFSPDARTLIVGGSKMHFLLDNQGGVQFWDVRSQQATGTLPGDTSDIMQIALSASGTLLATAHVNGRVSLWNPQTRRLLHQFESAPGGRVISLAFSPIEPLLAASDWLGNIVLYNTATLEIASPPLKAHSERVLCIAFSPDGRILASAGEGGGLKLWRVATRQVALTLKGHVGSIRGITFSRKGNLMVTCGTDATVRLWAAANLEESLK